MYYILYETTNIINGKKYIGKHITNDLDDGYLGSGLVLNKAISKYGREAFVRQTISYWPDEDSLNSAEADAITPEIVLSEEYYNIAYGGQGGVIVLKPGHPLYEETCLKISKSQQARSQTIAEHARRNHTAKKIGMHGKTQSEHQRKTASDAARRRPRSPEEQAKKMASYLVTITAEGYIHPLIGMNRVDAFKAHMKTKSLQSPRITCPHCGIITNAGNHTRYHGDRCKKRDAPIVSA